MNNTVTNDDPCLAHYGLVRDPFSTSPDESFFLLDSERAQRLNMLYHLVQDSTALLLLTGVKGSGKTSLLQKFLAMGNESWRYCLIRANAMMNPEQLLRHIAEGFGLEPDSINFSSALETLKKRLTELHRSGMTALLLVDDAHELPAASLTVIMKLSELRDDGTGLVRTVLLSEPQIHDLLSSTELADVRHRLTHKLEMPVLNKRQTIDYINYRLSVAGLDGKSPFSHWKIKKIHKLAHGIPALINEQANTMLHNAHDNRGLSAITGSSSNKTRTFILLVGLLGIAMLANYLLEENIIEQWFDTDSGQTIATLELPEVSKPVVLKPDPIPEPVPVQKKEIPVPVIAAEPEPKSVAAPLAKPLTEQKVDTPVAVEKVTAHPVSSEATTPTPAKETKADTEPTDWFTSQNHDHFTLQIMGGRNRTSIDEFIQTYKLGKDATILGTQHQGGQWYVLVYGSYPTKEAARTAISSLPAKLRKSSPWPRKIGDLKP